VYHCAWRYLNLGKQEKEGGQPTLFIAEITDWMDAMDRGKDVFGKVYIGFAGAGFVYGEELTAER